MPPLNTRGQPESDKEQREQHGRRQREKDHRGKDEERKRQRHHYEFDKFMRRKDETKWGKGYCQDRAKKEGHHHGYSYCPDGGDKLGKEDREDVGNRKERLRNKVSEKVLQTPTAEQKHANKDRPAMQLYQPGARNRKRMSSAGKGYDCIAVGHSPEPGTEHCYEAVPMATGPEKGYEKSKEEQ
ncbi:regulator of nonsense transcripts 3A [Notothenia coriiceps]|uniref:Regulator of nonsense transcripts 3A n=1 Tax=Notothenia coriiceps TaxID=8208 RepID=A0A6I9PMW6_9TELE|nr:PREDICTED: regulator of nonsense transcripts 3A [Notothenia coriiceps]